MDKDKLRELEEEFCRRAWNREVEVYEYARQHSEMICNLYDGKWHNIGLDFSNGGNGSVHREALIRTIRELAPQWAREQYDKGKP